MTIELVRTINGVEVERVDLRFVDDFRIDLGGVSPEVYAEFRRLEQWRRWYREYINNAAGVSANAMLKMLSEYVHR